MRTTLTVDDDLLRQLKQQAVKSRVPLRRLINSTLRKGLAAPPRARPRKPYSCPTFSLGQPRLNLDKALALAASLEDAEVLREIELRK